ncbi:MAG: T9SS type A sorting domain-containing protein, partial [Bacteroidia bacterium]
LISDIGVTQIISPTTVAALNQPNTVKVVIENFGTVPAAGFDVAYRVNGVEINSNAIARSIAPGDTIHHVFSQAWTPTVGGNLELCAFTRSFAGDVNPANDTTCATFNAVSVNALSMMLNRAYPNPANEQVNFELKEAADRHTRIVFTDQLGKTVLVHQAQEGEINQRVEVQNLATGMYQYRIERKDSVGHGKLMIKR